MKPKLLSVIMSVYNGEKHLVQAIESILNQTYQNFEFIIIDDCSTDNSLDILEEYAKKDSRIKIIKKEKNLGIKGFIENLNLGISIAEGKYIARMDADDISLPERFQKQVDFLEKNPEIILVGAQLNFINEQNEITGEAIGALEHRDIVKRITSKIPLFHPVIMFRKDQNIQYREKFLYCEDYDLYLNLITQGKKLANINEKLLNYRVLKTSISRKGDNFVKKLMVEKALYFYKLRYKIGKDFYENFNNLEVLEINNINHKNSKSELFFAMDIAIKLNKKEQLDFLLKKFKKYYQKEKIPFKYYIFSKLPLIIFRLFKKFYNGYPHQIF
ncbi:glycosyltransferase family 2 protein [Cloacibacterium sp.]|uniref:glycosyltransferase family 2 protein n=1 Tax=Cloacibacterium sp. TaxID=1913682 RepID=UPI0039E44253